MARLTTLKPRVKTLGQAERKPWTKLVEQKRLRGSGLQKARKRLFQANPLCVECEKQGRVKLATERDHIVALADGGQDIEANTQGLCHDCNSEKLRRQIAERYK